MKTKIAVAVVLIFTLARAGYGAGIDAKLSTENTTSYRQSLNEAWKDMSEAQQKAYTWAVGNVSLRQLVAKYPEMTPRKIIERETAEYIARKTKDVAELTAELAANADKLTREEAAVREAQAELSKLTATAVRFEKIPDNTRRDEEWRFIFTVKNDSRFNVSAAKWDAQLFINSEETSGRYCQISSDYQKDGGLAAGASKDDYITIIGTAEQCPRWKTLEVQNAASHIVNMALDEGSVQDFSNNRVLPHFSPVRADYERGIANAQADLQVAQKLRAALN